MTAIAKRGEFLKADGRLIYGWALVCEERDADGVWHEYVDTQGDHVPEDAMLEAALDYAQHSRVGKDMHGGPRVGSVPMLYPITRNANALGLECSKTGLLIAWAPDDPALLEAVANGERTGFSIGGHVLDAEDDTSIGKFAKSADAPVTKARVFRRFRIDEISLVDRPAMEGAVIGFVKRNSTPSATTEKVSTMNEDEYKAKIAEPEAALAAALAPKPEVEIEASADPIEPKAEGMTLEQALARIAELEAEKSAPKPEDEMAKADAVVFTFDDGTVVRKSDGPVAVKLATEARKAREALAHDQLAKRALAALPMTKGKDDVKVSLFKAAEMIGPEAVAILTGSEALWREAGVAKGATEAAPAAPDDKAEFEALVTKRMAEHKEARPAAVSAVLSTPDGARLYKAAFAPKSTK